MTDNNVDINSELYRVRFTDHQFLLNNVFFEENGYHSQDTHTFRKYFKTNTGRSFVISIMLIYIADPQYYSIQLTSNTYGIFFQSEIKYKTEFKKIENSFIAFENCLDILTRNFTTSNERARISFSRKNKIDSNPIKLQLLLKDKIVVCKHSYFFYIRAFNLYIDFYSGDIYLVIKDDDGEFRKISIGDPKNLNDFLNIVKVNNSIDYFDLFELFLREFNK